MPPSIPPAARTAVELKAELEREQGKLRALQDIGKALGSTLDLDELIGLLLTRITRIMDADQATLYVLDEASGELWSRFSHGVRPVEIRLEMGQGLPGWVAKNGRALNVKDAYQDVRFDSIWDRRTGYRTTSALCVPVKNHHSRTVGVLQVLNKRTGYFTLDDESMLTALASQVAVALENSKLFLSVVGKNMELLETKEQLEQKVRELDVLFEIAQVSASASNLDVLLEGVLARAMHAIDADAGSILLADEDTGELRFRAAVGGDPEAVKRLTVAPEDGICGWVAREGQAQVVNDVSADNRHSTGIAKQVGYHPKSVLCVPLMMVERRGALELLNKSQGRADFTEDDLKLASLIAGHIAAAIDLAHARRRREEEERMSTIGQLLSSVVHDLRGPMTVISGYARFLEGEDEADRRAEYGDAILRQVEAVNAMTGEILAFARGERKLLMTRVYLRKFFGELAEHLQSELEGRAVELQLQLEDRGVAWFDPHKIRRAIHNLVRNAAQAIGRSGGRIRIVVDRNEDGALVIQCQDDGPGVPEEIRGRVFESFTSHGKPDGTGLGLAIVQKVVNDHGGLIELNSEPGQTVFTMTLPQQRTHDTNAPPPDSTTEPQATA
ncbi:MAG: GAF domain-containing sensor histidine kinase [Myxococcales bacterium]|nr:GAF domain-containing sensor histidine kinase [Myxococcales bacterium]